MLSLLIVKPIGIVLIVVVPGIIIPKQEIVNTRGNKMIDQDTIREVANEVEDARFDAWLAENEEQLIEDFMNDYDFLSYCKEVYRDVAR
jgi:hypothetical protein